MCFSATASFAATGILLGASAVSFAVPTKSKHRWFAVAPLIFAVQQALEGFQWLSLEHGSGNVPIAYAYLFFACIFWPIFLPVGCYMIEKDSVRRKIIGVCVALGVFTAWALGLIILTGSVHVQEMGHSISYGSFLPLSPLFGVTYCLATCGAGFLVRRFWIQLFAALGLVGLIVSYVAYVNTFGSVWCFFAAILSLCVIMDLRSSPRPLKGKKESILL